jgi:hypothetical protein
MTAKPTIPAATKGSPMTRKFSMQVYDILCSLGKPGDLVLFPIRPWLEKEHGLPMREAVLERSKIMHDLDGRIERVNVRGPYVHIRK